MPDLTFRYAAYEAVVKANELFIANRGICPEESEIKYESYTEVFNRAKMALLKYTHYKKIIVVSHGVVMYRFLSSPDNKKPIPFCGIYEIDFDGSFPCNPFPENFSH
jgi:broad specificity phosphatase PhoE